MDRRQFLGRTTVSLAGLAAGGTAMGAGELRRATRERDDTALPGGPGRELGCRQLIWSVPTAEPLAALTFDDGPDPELTPRILAVLARYDVRATFNVMGYNAVRHGDLIRALVDGGHELGNHTWSHQDLASQSPTATDRQVEVAALPAAIERLLTGNLRLVTVSALLSSRSGRGWTGTGGADRPGRRRTAGAG